MSTKGILDCSILRGGVDGDAFYRSLQQSLLPHLLPYNGSNPSSVVIMDNASIHHIEEVGKTIQDAELNNQRRHYRIFKLIIKLNNQRRHYRIFMQCFKSTRA